MCVIGEGVRATLLKGGLVMLEDGSIYHLSDCTLKAGGTLSLSISAVPVKSSPNRIKIEGVSLLSLDHLERFTGGLEAPVVRLTRQEIKAPLPLPPVAEVPYTPFALIGASMLLLLKKIAGLDKQLKAGTCEMRHVEAINRIASLEGKVLRKQIVDGGKFVYGLKDKLSKGESDQEEEKES